MKNYNVVMSLFVLVGLLLSQSCDSNSDDDDDEVGNWIKSAPLEGSARSGAIVFTIENTAYIGLGRDNDNEYLLDFYAYDGSTGIWKEAEIFPGTGRERAVSFSINGKGYVGLGYNKDLDVEELADFWEYDPATNQWKQLNDFPGGKRYSAVSFDFDTKAYVGAGFDGTNTRGDFYQYNASADTWDKIATNPGEKKEGACAFIINEKAYYFGGRSNGAYSTDFWEFNSETNTWKDLTPDDDESYYDEFTSAVRRYDAAAFSINGNGYVATGNSGSNLTSVYEFLPGTSEWIKKTSFEGSARILALPFVLSGRGYLTTGNSGSRYLDDMWEFKPFEDYNEDD